MLEEQKIMQKLFYRENGTKRAFANGTMVILNVMIWCIMELWGDTLSGSYIMRHGGIYPDLLLVQGEWWRLISAMFIHFGAQHLANNMIILAAVGDKLENAVGSFRYLLIYLGSGLLGNVLSLYVMERTGNYAVSAGASGAVFGVIGALIWAAVRNRGKFEGLTTKGLLLMVALCLYYGISTTGVDNWAHTGGLVSGFFLCILCYPKKMDAEF